MNKPTTFDYNGYAITFNPTGENVFINATEMAKPFGKEPWGYLRNKSTQEFVNALKESQTANLRFEPVTTYQGGINSGTWMHEDVALDFAQWLSPQFKVWCIQKLKELLKTGKTEIKPKSKEEIIAEGYALALHEVKLLQERNEELEKEVEVAKPKLQVFNAYLDAENFLTVGEVARTVNIGTNKLFRILREDKIFLPNNTPYQRYMDRDKYFKVIDTPKVINGTMVNIPVTLVGSRGQAFIELHLRKRKLKQD